MTTEYYEETFEVKIPANLKVSNVRGPVTISEGDGGKIVVKATKHLDSGDSDNTIVEIFQRKDGTVEAITKHHKKPFSFQLKPCKVEYEITTPKNCSVKINSVNSAADIRGLEGEFKFNSVNGKMILKDLTGDFNIHSVNGKINAENLEGAVDIDSVNGKVAILASNLLSVKSNSVNGQVTIESPLGDGPYDFNSVSGTVKLVVPEGAGCTIEAKSISGRIKTDLRTTRYSKSPGQVYAELGGGGTRITMKSVSGGLYVVTDRDSKGSSLSNQLKVKSKEERLEALTKLEKGEISVEDTLKELNA